MGKCDRSVATAALISSTYLAHRFTAGIEDAFGGGVVGAAFREWKYCAGTARNFLLAPYLRQQAS